MHAPSPLEQSQHQPSPLYGTSKKKDVSRIKNGMSEGKGSSQVPRVQK